MGGTYCTIYVSFVVADDDRQRSNGVAYLDYETVSDAISKDIEFMLSEIQRRYDKYLIGTMTVS